MFIIKLNAMLPCWFS